MLLRRKPFREWITVYYDPAKTDEAKLLKILHSKRCKSSKVDRTASEKFTAMNKYASEGELVQLRIADAPKDQVPELDLPTGWEIFGDKNGYRNENGETFISVKVPLKAEQKNYTISLKGADGKGLETQVGIVRKIPSRRGGNKAKVIEIKGGKDGAKKKVIIRGNFNK